MKKSYFLSIIIVVYLFYTGCKKDEKKPNQNPTCEITAPANGQEIKIGEAVTISVDAEDKDGSIAEVRFFIDGVGKNAATSFPYTYKWNTVNENLGNHTLKVTSIDNNGGSTSDDISVTIIAGTPVADFTSDITTGAAPLTVNFTDQSTNTQTNWQWDFGDGGTSTQQNPSHTYNNAGSFTVTLTVTNKYGSDTKTKAEYIFVTGTFTDPRDEQIYTTVDIGSQIWMAENLKYLPIVSPSSDGSYDDPFYYVYDYQGTNVSEAKATSNFQAYGVLYNWSAALNACPPGWHLPTHAEWTALTDFIGGTDSPYGNELKSCRQVNSPMGGGCNTTEHPRWNDPGNGIYGTDDYGFSGLPGGNRDTTGAFNFIGYGGLWWSSTGGSYEWDAWSRYLLYDGDYVIAYYIFKEDGFSVRCLRD